MTDYKSLVKRMREGDFGSMSEAATAIETLLRERDLAREEGKLLDRELDDAYLGRIIATTGEIVAAEKNEEACRELEVDLIACRALLREAAKAFNPLAGFLIILTRDDEDDNPARAILRKRVDDALDVLTKITVQIGVE